MDNRIAQREAATDCVTSLEDYGRVGLGNVTKRKIAFISGTPRVSTKRMSAAVGARQYMLGTLSGFKANGCEVTPFIVGDKVPEKWLGIGTESSLANSFLKRLAADGMRILLSIIYTYLALREIKAPDWIYERCGPFQLFGYFYQRKGTPWVLFTESVMFEELVHDRKSIALPFLVRRIEQFAYRRCDILVVISVALKSALVKKFGIAPEKIVVLPNGADTETFDPNAVTPRRLFDSATFVIGFQGSMYKWAGLEYLLRAIAALRASGHNVAAVLLGDGHERRNLERLAGDLNIANWVKFPGLVSRDQVPEYIAGYDLCYAGQIDLEGNPMYLSPLKLYDYMAMGKPVIAARHADAVSLIKDDEFGYLFTPGDVDDLVAVATRVLRERDNLTNIGAAARTEILANHSWASRIRILISTVEGKLSLQRSQTLTGS